MEQEQFEIFNKAQFYAATFKVVKSEKFIHSFPRRDFYRALYKVMQQVDLQMEQNYRYYFETLEIKDEYNKEHLLKAINELAEKDMLLSSADIDRGLRCMAATFNIVIRDEQQRAEVMEEIWGELSVLLLHLYQDAEMPD